MRFHKPHVYQYDPARFNGNPRVAHRALMDDLREYEATRTLIRRAVRIALAVLALAAVLFWRYR